MKRSLQQYYEYLVSTQPDSVQRYLKKNGLLNFKRAFEFLSRSETNIIINGYEQNIELRVDYLFLKLRKNHKEKLSSTSNESNHTQKRTYIIDFTPLKKTVTHSDLLSLQDIYQQRMSRLSLQFLASHRIFGIEQMLPYIIGKQSVFSLLEECYGRKTQSEIYEALKVMRSVLETKGESKSAISLTANDEKRNDVCVELAEEDTKQFKNESDDHNVDVKTNLNSKQLLFDQWYKQLPVRAQHILTWNGLYNCERFCSQIEKEGFSFRKLRHCGQKTAKELELMAVDLKNSIMNNSSASSGDEHADLQNLLDTRLANTELSVRAKNCLSYARIWTLGDLVSLDTSSIMAINELGKKTFCELENFVKNRNLYFGYCSYQPNYQDASSEALDNPAIKKLKLTAEEKEFVHYFSNKYGFLPMVCLVVKRIHTILSKYELLVIEDRFRISEHDVLKGIDVGQKRYIFENAEKKIKKDITINALCSFDDWKNYGVYDLPACDWLFVGESKLNSACMCESEELFNYGIEQRQFKHFNFASTRTPILYMGFILQLFGMTCFWINNTTTEMSRYNSFDSSEWISSIFIKNRFCLFKYSKALNEVIRLIKLKTEENIYISIKGYFVENEEYWSKPIKLVVTEKDSMVEVLSALFKRICNVIINDGTILIRINKMNYSERLYEILKIAGTRLHRDDLFKRLIKVCHEKGFYNFDYTEPSQITTFLTRDPRIVPYGKSGFWGLKEWNETKGSIREIAIQIARKSKNPIRFNDLVKLIMKERPDSNVKSIAATITQSGTKKELLLFYGGYVGHPKNKYNEEYILMPQTFDEWLQAFKAFVMKNKRFPFNGNGYEGYLYRWHYRGNRFVNLSSDEIVKLDKLDKELSLYPQNGTEYNFLQNCNLYKKFVESNNRMLTEEDDVELFSWFYKTSRNYNNYDDNRNKYFCQLLQCISAIIY